VMGRWTPYPVLLLAGQGYATTDVARELGVYPLGRVPHDPRGAAVLSGGGNGLRYGRHGPTRSALASVARKVATVLANHHTPLAPGPHLLPGGQPAPLRAVSTARPASATARHVLPSATHATNGSSPLRGEPTS